MAEIGAILLLVCMMIISCILLFFGVDDKNPVLIVLSIAVFATVLIIMGRTT